jgi:hypothetical protein
MPALPEVAAVIDNGMVVNVAALSTDVDYSGWLDAMRADHDSVLIVPSAGIGWEEYKKGKLRPPAPSPECTWDDKAGLWVCPEPEPDTDLEAA